MNDEIRDAERERVAAYVLGSLDEAERDEVELLLERSPALLEYARWLQPAVDALPRVVPREVPSPALKERLMAEVAEDLRPLEVHLARSRRRFSIPRLRLAAAGAMAVALLAAPIGYLIGSGDSESVSVVSRSPDGATAALVREDGDARLRVSGMSPPREGVYQVWIRTGERVRPSAAFVTDRHRRATADIREDLSGADELLVTAEPRAGLERPTGSPVLRVPVTAG